MKNVSTILSFIPLWLKNLSLFPISVFGHFWYFEYRSIVAKVRFAKPENVTYYTWTLHFPLNQIYFLSKFPPFLLSLQGDIFKSLERFYVFNKTITSAKLENGREDQKVVGIVNPVLFESISLCILIVDNLPGRMGLNRCWLVVSTSSFSKWNICRSFIIKVESY